VTSSPCDERKDAGAYKREGRLRNPQKDRNFQRRLEKRGENVMKREECCGGLSGRGEVRRKKFWCFRRQKIGGNKTLPPRDFSLGV
jgi:hypothetical protein